jgi:hypothetical protein
MKVRSSTRATSLGSLQARKLSGRSSGLSFLKRAGGHQLLAQAVVLLGLAAVAPVDVGGFGQGGHLGHPGAGCLT